MFWSWNSGYIFVKLEGISPVSRARKHTLTFHIGGVMAPNNTIRTFHQELPEKLIIKKGKSAKIHITANANALFKVKSIIDFADLNFTMGGPESVEIADNYVNGLFRVDKVN